MGNPDLKSEHTEFKATDVTRSVASVISLPDATGKESVLATSVESRARSFAARFEKKRVTLSVAPGKKPRNQPFFVDTRANVYSVLTEPDGSATESGYNTSVGLLAQQQTSYLVGGFTLDKISESDKLLDEYVGVINSRVHNKNLGENFFSDRSQFGKIGKLAMYTLASEFWTKEIGFDPLVPSEYLDIARKEKESLPLFKKRRDEFLKAPMRRYSRKLAGAIRDSLSHEKAEAHANALVHLLLQAFKSVGHRWFLSEIEKNDNLIPSAQELKRLGKIPDVKIREFQSLFHTVEWKIIASSKLYKAETTIKDLLKKKLEMVDSVHLVLSQIDNIRKEIDTDLLSKEILHLKKIRLGHAARWRREIPRDTVLRVLQQAPKRLNEEKVFDDFSPFTIAAASGIAGAESGLSRAVFAREINVYQWLEAAKGERTSDEVNELGQMYVTFLNSK